LQAASTAAGSNSGSSQPQMLAGYSSTAACTASTFASGEIYIPNYAGGLAKSVSAASVTEHNGGASGDAYIVALAGLWSLTSAITSIELLSQVANFVTGSSFYLYGIKNSDDNSPGTFGIQATGGDVTISGGYKYHVFKSSGTFTVTEPGWVEYLTIAGGASGGSAPSPFHEVGGGGGAGGYVYGSRYIENGPHNVLVGAGGPSRNVFTVSGRGLPGSDSSIGSTVVAIGGGSGGGFYETGVTGGSGGGGGGNAGTSGAAGISGQGNSGGNGTAASSNSAGGGGGGAGSSGANASGNNGGAGGAGSNAHLSWANVTGTGVSGLFAGGGGGSRSYSGGSNGAGGSGGGGAGGGSAGTINTGSGGGGNFNGGASGAGGSGIIIVRYPVS